MQKPTTKEIGKKDLVGDICSKRGEKQQTCRHLIKHQINVQNLTTNKISDILMFKVP